MRARVDLALIRAGLADLNDSTYFEKKLHRFTEKLIEAIDHVLDSPATYIEEIEREFADLVLRTHAYLSGSTTNEIPYEVVYCLNAALQPWLKRDTAILTRLTDSIDGPDFHANVIEPWTMVSKTLTGFDPKGYDLSIAMIGVPRLYAHKPLFCIPLYHELGHFVDRTHEISVLSLLRDTSSIAPTGTRELYHRLEYFADLFAAAHLGRCSIAALETIAPDAPHTATHPSTVERVRIVETFLAGESDPIIEMFQACLSARGLPRLAPSFKRVDVKASFDDLKTYVPKSIAEVHGLYGSAWDYLDNVSTSGSNPWGIKTKSDTFAESIINDLTEKSIRNTAIRMSWDEAATAR